MFITHLGCGERSFEKLHFLLKLQCKKNRYVKNNWWNFYRFRFYLYIGTLVPLLEQLFFSRLQRPSYTPIVVSNRLSSTHIPIWVYARCWSSIFIRIKRAQSKVILPTKGFPFLYVLS